MQILFLILLRSWAAAHTSVGQWTESGTGLKLFRLSVQKVIVTHLNFRYAIVVYVCMISNTLNFVER